MAQRTVLCSKKSDNEMNHPQNLKQVFSNMKDNFVSTSFANGAGKISKHRKVRIRNFFKNGAQQLVEGFGMDFSVGYFQKGIEYTFGGLS